MPLKRIGVKQWLSMLPVLVIWLRHATKKWKKSANLKIVPLSMSAVFLRIKLSLLGINFCDFKTTYFHNLTYSPIFSLFWSGGLMHPQKEPLIFLQKPWLLIWVKQELESIVCLQDGFGVLKFQKLIQKVKFWNEIFFQFSNYNFLFRKSWEMWKHCLQVSYAQKNGWNGRSCSCWNIFVFSGCKIHYR